MTARHLQEAKPASELERLKATLAAIVDSLPSMIAVVDRDGCIDIWNEQAALYTGIDSENAYGRPIESLLPSFSHYLQQVREVVDQQEPCVFERIQLFADSGRRYFSLQIVPLAADDEGRAVVRIDDTTDHIRIEGIMMQTEKMMMVGGLAAGMAHEINNPLGAIMQHAQNIERRVSADIPANHKVAEELGVSLDAVREYFSRRGILEFIAHIREGGVRTAKIIDNMLKFSRKSDSISEVADLAEVIDQTLELAANDYDLKKRYDFKHIEIVRVYAADMPRITITVLEIEQVLLNIIKNAAQAMAAARQQAPRLVIRLDRQGDFARIRIEDNGPGMSDAVRRRIFEPFYTTKEVGIGTGLGLSVSYSIITANHHGMIEVVSQENEGACFIVQLPINGRKP